MQENYTPLLRPTDEFAAKARMQSRYPLESHLQIGCGLHKVTYEHQAALAEGAFQAGLPNAWNQPLAPSAQDRTKCHAAERVADVNKKRDPWTLSRAALTDLQVAIPVLELKVRSQRCLSVCGGDKAGGRWFIAAPRKGQPFELCLGASCSPGREDGAPQG